MNFLSNLAVETISKNNIDISNIIFSYLLVGIGMSFAICKRCTFEKRPYKITKDDFKELMIIIALSMFLWPLFMFSDSLWEMFTKQDIYGYKEVLENDPRFPRYVSAVLRRNYGIHIAILEEEELKRKYPIEGEDDD